MDRCLLTNTTGTFVKAHILPQALTSPAPGGTPFVQSGLDHPPITRRTSWYDAHIVTRAGEDILAAYDNWAIQVLRRHKLVWSGWGEKTELEPSDFELIGDTGWGVRQIVDIDAMRLRLFFLSLLWRASVSQMVEFQEFNLPPSDIRRLRKILVSRDGRPLSRFPISLTQFSTRGDVHNLTPLVQRRSRDPSDHSKGYVNTYRIYLDGLVVQIHRKDEPRKIARQSDTLVGVGQTIRLGAIRFEGSWQASNMDALVRNAEERCVDRRGKGTPVAG